MDQTKSQVSSHGYVEAYLDWIRSKCHNMPQRNEGHHLDRSSDDVFFSEEFGWITVEDYHEAMGCHNGPTEDERRQAYCDWVVDELTTAGMLTPWDDRAEAYGY